MTREEAIKIIDDECEHIKHHLTEKGKAEEFYIELGNMLIAFYMAIKALEQEPSRDIKEIAEIMKCGWNAETKCKMISNILTAKPHYFAEQEPTDEWQNRDFNIECRNHNAMLHKAQKNVIEKFKSCADMFSDEELKGAETVMNWIQEAEQDPTSSCDLCKFNTKLMLIEANVSGYAQGLKDNIMRCKDCKYFERWRSSEATEKHGQVYSCGLLVISNPSPDDYCSKAESEDKE